MSRGIFNPLGYDQATLARGIVMTAHDRVLPTEAEVSIGSGPDYSSEVWRNDSSSLLHFLWISVHSLNDTLDPDTTVTTVSIYQWNPNDLVSATLRRKYRIPLVASETYMSPDPLVMMPDDRLLIVDDSGDGVNYSIEALRQV